MTLARLWKRRNGLTLIQRRQLDIERIQEQMVEREVVSLFASSEALAELEREHKAYVEQIEARIAGGWQPNRLEWLGIETNLKEFAKRRGKLIDPLGVGEIVKSMAQIDAKRREQTSIFDRYVAIHGRRYW